MEIDLQRRLLCSTSEMDSLFRRRGKEEGRQGGMVGKVRVLVGS